MSTSLLDRPQAAPSREYPRAIVAIRAMPYSLAGFRKFCRLLVLEDGTRFKLAPFQGFLMGLFFLGIRELVIIIAKKNGKTTLLAALALYHLLMIESAECVIGASSREQAAILFNQADGLVKRSGLEVRPLAPGPSHRGLTQYEGVFDVKSGTRIIRFERGRIRVLAAAAAGGAVAASVRPGKRRKTSRWLNDR